MSDPDYKLIALGKQADGLLNNEAFELAVAMLEQEVIQEWIRADSVGPRERAHVKVAVIRELLQQLDRIIGEGALEEAKVEKDETD